jgi:phosphotransferase system HPr-like phosphotransfer protein
MIALCATMGTALDVEAAGEDEEDAIQAVQQVFSSINGNDFFAGAPRQKS